MGPPSYMRSVVGWNVVMRRMTVLIIGQPDQVIGSPAWYPGNPRFISQLGARYRVSSFPTYVMVKHLIADCDSFPRHIWLINQWPSRRFVGRDSSVGIATRYWLEVRRSNPGGGRDFPHLSRPALGPHPASYKMGTGFFPGVKSGLGVSLTTPPPQLEPGLKKE